ncbi:uncharacterized protein [Diadema antillarum]|uniref:uncharacterized protein isoform X1 n=1 Tax=Diadema antillarum TaxID=105358 RepID=UPI003A8C6605
MVDIQLRPVQIQEGVKIRFLVGNLEALHIQPYRVSQVGFDSCDTLGGEPVIDSPTDQPFIVPDGYLQAGSNFFIVNTANPLFQCRFGLRVNVTVKQNDCHYPVSPEGMECLDHGVCLTNVAKSKYTCSCCHGYTGDYCQELDGCANHQCAEGAQCVDVVQGFEGHAYECQCPEGRSGVHCEVDVNECDSNPCVNGVCVDRPGSFQCYCVPGYTGTQCQIQYNECVSNPCLNGGFCIDELNNYRCDCSVGYTGPHCEEKVDLCASSPCHNATVCVDEGSTYSCTCAPGFTGVQCEVNINECQSSPCLNGGSCRDDVNSYRCICPEDFGGVHCQISEVFIEHEPPHYNNKGGQPHNYYIVIGVLAGALSVAMSIIAICVCWLQKGTNPRKIQPISGGDDDRFFYNISSVTKPRPSVQAIYELTSTNYSTNVDEPLISLKPKSV